MMEKNLPVDLECVEEVVTGEVEKRGEICSFRFVGACWRSLAVPTGIRAISSTASPTMETVGGASFTAVVVEGGLAEVIWLTRLVTAAIATRERLRCAGEQEIWATKVEGRAAASRTGRSRCDEEEEEDEEDADGWVVLGAALLCLFALFPLVGDAAPIAGLRDGVVDDAVVVVVEVADDAAAEAAAAAVA